MARFLFVALVSLVAVPAVGQPTPEAHPWRIREFPIATKPTPPPPGAAFGPTSRIGVGMFGLKNQTAFRSVTVDEVTAPKSRRPGVGFSLKF
jgi:hypothetical protein